MRYFRIFILHFQDVLTDRTRSLVWLALPVVNGGFFLIFWHAAFLNNSRVLTGWDSNSIMIYYLFMIIAGAMLVSHIEDHVLREIHQGEIVKYLLKPFPYYTFLLFLEVPYRLLQGSYAIIGYIILAIIFPVLRIATPDIWTILLLVCMFICSFFLIHTYKLTLALISFWTKDIRGFTETSDVIFILFAGLSVPLDILPGILHQISTILPYSYFVYFPVIGLMGKISFDQLLFIFMIQLIWLGAFIIIYKVMLAKGLKRFTAVGQ